jgi:hypothetical protein
MDLRGQEIKNTYGNVVTIGSAAGSPTTGELTNGQNTSFTSTYLGGNFGIGSVPTTYGSLNVLALGSAGSAAGGIIDIVGTSGRLASIYTEASGKLVFTADPTNGEAGTAMEFNVDGSNAMFIDSSRNVGIGLVLPTELLHVAGNLKLSDGADRSIKGPTNANLIISNNASSSAQGIKFSTDGGTTTDVFIQDGGNVGISDPSPSFVLDVNNTSSRARFKASTGDSSIELSSIAGRDWLVSSKTDGAFSIYDEDAASERMRIDSGGAVLVNKTSSTGDIFQVQGNDSVYASRFDGSVTAGQSYGLRVRAGTNSTDTGLLIENTSGTDLFIVKGDGNVGIGITTPETKLDVDGDIQTAAPETSTNAAWKLGNVGLGGVDVGPIDYITVSVGGFVVKLPIAIFPETQAFYDRVIADGGTFEGLLGYESAVTILKAQ